eukprot:403348797
MTASISCVDFSDGTIPECITMGTIEDIASQSFTQNMDDYNAQRKIEDPTNFVPFTYPGYEKAYYVQFLTKQSAETKECYFIADKTSAVFYMDLQSYLSYPGAITAKVHQVSGPNCERVASRGTDIVSNQQYFPSGNAEGDNCAYLFHFQLIDTAGAHAQKAIAVQNFIVYYNYTSKPYATSATQ